MKISEGNLSGLKLIEPRVFEDDRGYFKETFRASILKEHGITKEFVQGNISKSYKDTIRGLHYQLYKPQAKLIQCIKGKILDVAVDIRKNSETFGKYEAVILSDKNHHLFYIPEGFAHGFSVLSDEAIVHYKVSDYYDKPSERGIRWDDPLIRVHWDVARPIISDKDRKLPLFSALKDEDIFL